MPREITELLIEARSGKSDAVESLYGAVYDELRRIARNQLARRGRGTLQTTELVNEAYVKLVRADELRVEDRVHFFALSARAMRQILVDHFRRRGADKRGGGMAPIEFDEGAIPDEERGDVILALDAALEQLSQLNRRLSDVVEWKFFGGLTETEIAGLLGVTDRTVRNDWRKAKAWLRQTLTEAT